ncbi:MAG: iron-containing alcohol dehydrogenase [Planctomycetota bacterium]|jgi:alcohol dehydrogenase
MGGELSALDFTLRTRIVFGLGAADNVGTLACDLVPGEPGEVSAKRVFLVTDPGIVAEGYAESVERSLRGSGLEVRRFDGVRENPTTADVDACLRSLGDFEADVMVGLGGGSSIDVAKGCNFLHAGGGRMEDYWGIHKAKGNLLPLIAIPTTAGTGTEMQSFALVAQEETHQKMACGDPQAAPRIAILDPCLTVTKPRFLTACTGLDTIGHAVETAVTTRRNPLSSLFSTESFRLAQANLPVVLKNPGDLEARGHMLRAAAFGGVAIETSMLGAAHSMANPLTAHYKIPHGQAVGMMLPHIVRFNRETSAATKAYAELARAAGLCGHDTADSTAVDALLARLGALLLEASMPASLAALDVPEDATDKLAEEAACQWTAQFNPRPVTAADFRELFTTARSMDRA